MPTLQVAQDSIPLPRRGRFELRFVVPTYIFQVPPKSSGSTGSWHPRPESGLGQNWRQLEAERVGASICSLSHDCFLCTTMTPHHQNSLPKAYYPCVPIRPSRSRKLEATWKNSATRMRSVRTYHPRLACSSSRLGRLIAYLGQSLPAFL